MPDEVIYKWFKFIFSALVIIMVISLSTAIIVQDKPNRNEVLTKSELETAIQGQLKGIITTLDQIQEQTNEIEPIRNEVDKLKKKQQELNQDIPAMKQRLQILENKLR